MKPASALLMPLLLVPLLAFPAQGQYREGDPRGAGKDPQSAGDPRAAGDPRDVDVATQDASRTERLGGTELFEKLYATGEFPKLATSIGASSWQVLGWVDTLCDQWLQLVETGALDEVEGRADANELRIKLLEVTQLCDTTLDDTTFKAHAERLMTWDKEQVATYREGQALFAQALTIYTQASSTQHANLAKDPLFKAIDRLRTLGSTWQVTQCRALLGRIQMANREFAAARATMKHVVQDGGQVRQLDDVWDGLGVLYTTALQKADYNGAEEILKSQYRITVETGDRGLAGQVVQRLAELTDFRRKTGL